MINSETLPAVHLSVDELEKIERLLRENTTDCEIEIVLSLPGGVDQRFNSASQIETDLLADIAGSDSYSISVDGKEGQCTIAGESSGTESHMMYCRGNDDWYSEVRNRVKSYVRSNQTAWSQLRSELTGGKATAAAVIGAFFVGWALTVVAPQSIVHYFPTPVDALIFSVGTFGLLIVRFRNWVHPYVQISHKESHPSKRRIAKIGLTTLAITLFIVILRGLVGPGPFIRWTF